MNISEYWHDKKPVPDNVKDYISSLVKGECAGSFDICGKKHHLLKVDGAVFRKVFIENRKYLFKGDYTAPPNENDHSNSTNYLADDGLAGFSITDEGWLVSLFSNYREGSFAKSVKDLVIRDAYKLVCIVADTDDGNRLVDLYEKHYGFRKYAATINDTDIMRKCYGDEFIDSFLLNNGVPFHVFMIGKNATGSGQAGIRRFEDYFEAEAYVDQTVTREM